MSIRDLHCSDIATHSLLGGQHGEEGKVEDKVCGEENREEDEAQGEAEVTSASKLRLRRLSTTSLRNRRHRRADRDAVASR